MRNKLKVAIVIVILNFNFSVLAEELTNPQTNLTTAPINVSEICTTLNSSSWGQDLQCKTPSLAYGLCGSGKNTDCNNGSTANQLYCCQEPKVDSIGTTTVIKSSNFGERISCPTGQLVVAFCGSGKNKDCDNGTEVNTITCAIVDSIALQNETNTWFSSANFGEPVFCPNAMVMTGACGSGKNQDCTNGTVNEIRCTTYTIVNPNQ